MTDQVELTLCLLTIYLVKQHKALERIDTRLTELMDHIDSVGDGLWRMERGNRVEASPVNQARAKKHPVRRKKARFRNVPGKQI